MGKWIERGEHDETAIIGKQYETFRSITQSAFGAELLRHSLLPELLGKNAPSLLYWAGRQLARRYPLRDLEQIAAFLRRPAGER